MTELAVGFTTTVYENVFSVSKVFLGLQETSDKR